MLSSPNPAVAQGAACVGHEGACAAAGTAPLGGGWLIGTKLGRAMLALIGLGSEVQGMAEGVPSGRGIAGLEAKGAAAAATSLTDDLTAAAQRAAQSVGPGRGPVYGTKVHSAFEREVNALGKNDVHTEVSYLNGQIVPYGTKGSVRLDVVNGPVNSPNAVYDLKTGSATLTPARIQQIQSHLPGGNAVPVMEIRP